MSVDSCIVGIELNKNLIQLREAILHFKVKSNEFMPQKTIWALKSVTERANAFGDAFFQLYIIYFYAETIVIDVGRFVQILIAKAEV